MASNRLAVEEKHYSLAIAAAARCLGSGVGHGEPSAGSFWKGYSLNLLAIHAIHADAWEEFLVGIIAVTDQILKIHSRHAAPNTGHGGIATQILSSIRTLAVDMVDRQSWIWRI